MPDFQQKEASKQREMARQFCRNNLTILCRDVIQFKKGSDNQFDTLREMASFLKYAKPFQLNSARMMVEEEAVKRCGVKSSTDA